MRGNPSADVPVKKPSPTLPPPTQFSPPKRNGKPVLSDAKVKSDESDEDKDEPPSPDDDNDDESDISRFSDSEEDS